MPNMYGYVRVSTKEQNEARQLDALAAYLIPKKHLYLDNQSGKNFDRPAWRKLVKRQRQAVLCHKLKFPLVRSRAFVV